MNETNNSCCNSQFLQPEKSSMHWSNLIQSGFHYLEIKVSPLLMECEPVFRSQCRTLADTSIPAKSHWCEPGGLLQAEFNYPDGNCFLIQNFNSAFFSIMKNEREKRIHWVWALLVYEITAMGGKHVPGLLQLPAAPALSTMPAWMLVLFLEQKWRAWNSASSWVCSSEARITLPL